MTVAAASNLANMPGWPPHLTSADASEAAAGGEAAAKYHQLSGVRARVSGGQTTAGAGAGAGDTGESRQREHCRCRGGGE